MARSYQDLLAVGSRASAGSTGRRPGGAPRRGRRPAGDRHPRAERVGRGAHPRRRSTSRAASSRAGSPGSRRPDQEVVLSCASGHRSLLAGTTLQDDGLRATWRASPAASSAGSRAATHYDVPQTLTPGPALALQPPRAHPRDGRGGPAQAAQLQGAPDRRRRARRSPAAFYLAAAGVGTIGLVDDDVVDASNLQRQIIHTTDRVGMNKGESAQRRDRGAQPGRAGQRPPLPRQQGQRPRPASPTTT